jgi:hypothetical protein
MKFKIATLFIGLLIFNACATYTTQYKEVNKTFNIPDKEIEHSFYFIGDAGNSPLGMSSAAIKAFKKELDNGSKNSTAIFLGDNIYPKGLPKKGEKGRDFAEHQLNIQTAAVKDFKGETIFIPGNHDWYNNGLKGLKRQEKYIEDILGKNTFLPENGCPIEKVDISDEIVLIVVDSEWYLTNWDRHPTINDDCEIKTRVKFFDELEGLIKKARGKTTLIAMHHPMFTNGPHGGQYSFGSHMKPIPVLGTLKNILRKTSGVSPADLQNKKYNAFKKRVVTIAQENDKVVFVSGHEHSLQYLVQDNLPQIISGSGSKSTATRNTTGLFSSSNPGFARYDVFSDGSSYVRFYSAERSAVIYQSEVWSSDVENKMPDFDTNVPSNIDASIYSEEEIKKSKFYKIIWGERYRKYYGTKVNVPTVNLDTLFGGLKPTRKGGGHQSKSLQLMDKEGKRYVMRALRKSATVYLQAMAFKDQYIEGQFDNTVTERLLQDFYTGAHPYAPFVTGGLSDAISLYHTNPILYYVPKQDALAHFNIEFGNELYMIEEHVSDGHGNIESFGFANTIESTDDFLKKLRKDEKYVVDDEMFLRARLFDMVIGDWDRHVDQWRWAEFKDEKSGKVVYKPIPRDRDQVFSIMGDGALMNFATRVVPPLKLMEGFMDDIRNVKGFNFSPFSLDMTLLNETSKSQWDEQVKLIQNNLTETIIDEAFKSFPREVQDQTIVEIKRVLLARIKNLPRIANEYYQVINKIAVVIGTDKDDWFNIERMSNGNTKLTAYRIKNNEKGVVFFEKTYRKNETKEIWIYGLDDEDVFNVTGESDNLIKVRLIGGQNKDTYTINNGKKVKMYDFKSKKNQFTTNKGCKKLTDDYETNVYDYTKLKNSTNQLIPTIGSNPDDGFKFGFVNTLTNYGFERNPFSSQHTFSGVYYFATEGYDLYYNGEFAKLVGNWNLGLVAKYTSPNYSINFFGFGNSTPNDEVDDLVDLDYNRVKLGTLKFSPSLIWRGELGASFKIGLSYESIEVEETIDRFVNTFYVVNGEENHKNFMGAEAYYSYKNKDNEAFPTLGMQTSLQLGYKSNVDNSRGFGYFIPELGFDYKLEPGGQLVVATKAKAHFILGDEFEFYQGASIGGDDGLRGYRNQRFTGENSFYQSTDLRLNLRKVKTGLLPLNIGIYGGFDYGKVWVDETLLLDATHGFDDWNTSVGGGVFANAADIMTLNVSAFHGNDGLRLAFKLGFGF